MKLLSIVITLIYMSTISAETMPEKYGAIDVELFVGKQEHQPLVVGFGGGEGGNAWASDHWKKTRDEFLAKGYAFLAVGYFGMSNTQEFLDRVSLDAIYEEIIKAGKNPKIDAEKIALIGGSKGAELALNLASRYQGITAVVAIVPSHVSFPGLTFTMDHSSWTYNNVEVPYVPANERIIPAAMKGDHHTVFSIMLEDESFIEAARIPVEKINGPILILSAREDEMWPSFKMSEELVNRLEKHKFPHHYEHIVSEGGHASPLEKFPEIFNFLDEHFKQSMQK